MTHDPDSLLLLSCPSCGWRLICGPGEMTTRLRRVGMLKRATEPDMPLLLELFRTAADRSTCDACQHTGLTVSPAPADEWGDERACESCGKAIPRERLELFPDSTLCVTCQQRADSSPGGTDDYCPRCGAKMTVRQKKGPGIARYELVCPECRR